MVKTYYTNDPNSIDFGISPSMYRVVYRVKSTNRHLTREFSSPYQARLFVNKIMHSKKCLLISTPFT